ncbi:hypothetical protein B0T14DRAFT_178997 [Immersiella caudata]|uniref:Uncharacterized protein n=1 Tax=Immersiella caudata TaxID=314043 RepID=A0AA39WXH9_9PEZI|nr:hypothetical protein B0T14DRAFT_178997 [Immersiella caudata]
MKQSDGDTHHTSDVEALLLVLRQAERGVTDVIPLPPDQSRGCVMPLFRFCQLLITGCRPSERPKPNGLGSCYREVPRCVQMEIKSEWRAATTRPPSPSIFATDDIPPAHLNTHLNTHLHKSTEKDGIITQMPQFQPQYPTSVQFVASTCASRGYFCMPGWKRGGHGESDGESGGRAIETSYAVSTQILRIQHAGGRWGCVSSDDMECGIGAIKS